MQKGLSFSPFLLHINFDMHKIPKWDLRSIQSTYCEAKPPPCTRIALNALLAAVRLAYPA
jgi:hypothetical protein